MADIHGSPAAEAQNPQAGNAGSAPVPYTGPRPSTLPGYSDSVDLGDGTAGILSGIPSMPGLSVQPWAHDLAAGTADAPYYGGPLAPIISPVDGDADEQDIVAATVAGAMAATTATWQAQQQDTYGAGSTIGDLVALPPDPLDPGVGSLGTTLPSGDFYDPPREY